MLITLLISFIFGICVGSFITVIAHRLPLQLKHNWKNDCLNYLNQGDLTQSNAKLKPFKLIGFRSHCLNCEKKIPFYHNIPILSFLILKGRCKFCHNQISKSYPMTELISGIACALIIYAFGLTLISLFALIFIFSLITLAVIDYKTQLLPDIITLPLLWLGLIINSFSYFTSLEFAVFGAVFGYGVLWLMYMLYKTVKHMDGLGHGDFKCLAAICAWLGINALIPVLLIASIAALIMIAFRKLITSISKKHTKPDTSINNVLLERIAFGPYLALGSVIVLFWHNNAIFSNINITSIL